jgi:hypothetical protein
MELTRLPMTSIGFRKNTDRQEQNQPARVPRYISEFHHCLLYERRALTAERAYVYCQWDPVVWFGNRRLGQSPQDSAGFRNAKYAYPKASSR